jgi:arginase
LRDRGLVEKLRTAHVDVRDGGDLQVRRWQPDPARADAQNIRDVVEHAQEVARTVTRAVARNETPLVIGGECSTTIGTAAGLVGAHERVGVIYFDLHADLNIPDSVSEGAFSWMVTAHLLGEPGAVTEVCCLGPRDPLLRPDELILFAHDWTRATPHEQAAIERLGLTVYAVADVRRDPVAVADAAAADAERRWDRFLVHLDVDVVDFNDAPLSENPGRGTGLQLRSAMTALRPLVQSPKCAAITIAEINPLHGAEDGSTLDRLIAGLARALTPVAAARSGGGCQI